MKTLKKLISKTLVLFMVFVLFFGLAPSLNAGATGTKATTTIGVSKKTLNVGDTLSVTITCSADAAITLKFTAARLKLENAGSANVDGNAATFTGRQNTFKFSCTEAGKADLIVTSSTANVEGSSASVTITDAAGGNAAAPASSAAAPQAPASSQAQPQAPASSAAETKPAETSAASSQQAQPQAVDLPKGQVSVNGQIYAVSERYTDAQIPAGFSKTPLSIAKGSYNEPSNGTVTLVYLKKITDGTMANNGTFFYYDDATKAVLPIMPYMNSYLVPMPDSSVAEGEALPAASFIKSALTYENSGTAVTLPDSYVLKDTEPEFYYFYGKTFDGKTTWYSYDTVTKSVQRANIPLVKAASGSKGGSGEAVNPDAPGSGTDATSEKPADQSGEKKSGFSFQKILLIIIIFLVVFIILVIISMIPRSRRRDDDDDDEEEEDFGRSIVKKEYLDEDEEDDELPFDPRKDEEEYDDDEYDDEEEEEEEIKPKKAPEKTRVMPDMSDNGLRKILSSDSIIAAGQEKAAASEGAASQRVKSQTPERPVQKPVQKPVSKPSAIDTYSARPQQVQPQPAPQAPKNGNGNGSGSGSIDVMDLNDL